MILVSLVNNIALLLSLLFIYGLIMRRRKMDSLLYQAFSGLLFGAVTVVGMATPVRLMPGVIFDGRSIVLGIAGLFGGPITAAIAAIIAAGYRLSLGGAGALMGISVIAESAALGIGYYYLRRQRPELTSPWHLLGFGLLVHVVMLILMTALPRGISLEVLRQVGLLIVTVYPLATLVMALLFLDQEAQIQAEAELRIKTAELDRYFDINLDLLCIADLDGTFRRLNPEWENALGYPVNDLIGRRFMELVHPEDVAATTAAMADLGRQKAVFDFVNRYRAQDGSYRWIEWRAYPVQGLIYATARDITARLQAEEALRESESKFRSLAESSQDYIMRYDRHYRHLYENPAALKVSGMTEADIIGKTHREAGFSEDLAEFWESRIQHVFDTAEIVQTQFDWESPHGLATLDWMLVPEFDEQGHVHSVLGVSRDITELKRGQQALAHERYLLHTLMDNVPDAIYFKDAQGCFLRVNRAHAVHVGLDDPLQAVGRTDHDYFSDEHAQQAFEDELTVMRTGEPIMKEERETWPDGHETWVLTSKFPFRDEQSHIIGTFGISKDITERKRQEEERLGLERRLLQSQKLESLGVLAGGVAHDFNNLLMAILGNLDLALSDVASTSIAHESIEEAARAARRAADLTRQMLAYAGKGRFVVTQVDPSALVAENANLFRTVISRAIRLDLHLAQGLPPIEADVGQLQQVIMNLLTNASEAIGEQGGTITIDTGVLDCDETYLGASRIGDPPQAGKFVFIQVADTGCGMDEETQRRIFEPFYTTKFTGRGLGMSAVQGVMRGHGGALMLDSTVGVGTTIRVLFPVAPSPSEPEHKDSPSVAPPPRAPKEELRGTVLVVDDEPEVRQVCATMVARMGFETLTAEDGPSAIKLFRAQAGGIDVVILDLSMPKMDGLATLQELLRINPQVKVLLSSGYNEQQTTLRYTSQGLAGFIQKPYRLASLRAELIRLTRKNA